MRNLDEFDHVQSLIASGMNDCAIARETGIPRTTIRGWRLHPPTRLVKHDPWSSCGVSARLHLATGRALRISVGPIPRRWLHLALTTGIATSDRSR